MEFEEKYWDDALAVLQREERKAFWALWAPRAIFLLPLLVSLGFGAYFLFGSASAQALRGKIVAHQTHLNPALQAQVKIYSLENNRKNEADISLQRSLAQEGSTQSASSARSTEKSNNNADFYAHQEDASAIDTHTINPNSSIAQETKVASTSELNPENGQQNTESPSDFSANGNTGQTVADSQNGGQQNAIEPTERPSSSDLEEEYYVAPNTTVVPLNETPTSSDDEVRTAIQKNLADAGINTPTPTVENGPIANKKEPIESKNKLSIPLTNYRPTNYSTAQPTVALLALNEPIKFFPSKFDNTFVQFSNSMLAGYGTLKGRDNLNLGAALGYEKVLSPIWSFSGAIGAYQIGGVSKQVEIKDVSLGFTRTYNSTLITASELVLLNAPFSAHYTIKNRLIINAGAEIDFLINVKSDLDYTSTDQAGTNRTVPSETEWGYSAGFNRILPNAFGGLGFRITPGTTLFCNYHFGLKTIGKSEIYQLGKNDKNQRLEFGLRWSIRP